MTTLLVTACAIGACAIALCVLMWHNVRRRSARFVATRQPPRPFAIVDGKNSILFVTLARSDSEAWEDYLGGPDDTLLASLLRAGLRCRHANIELGAETT